MKLCVTTPKPQTWNLKQKKAQRLCTTLSTQSNSKKLRETLCKTLRDFVLQYIFISLRFRKSRNRQTLRVTIMSIQFQFNCFRNTDWRNYNNLKNLFTFPLLLFTFPFYLKLETKKAQRLCATLSTQSPSKKLRATLCKTWRNFVPQKILHCGFENLNLRYSF